MRDLDVDLLNRTAYHPPSDPAVIKAHELMREMFGGVLILLNATLADGREKSLALTAAGEALMYANQSIAMNQTGIIDPDAVMTTASSRYQAAMAELQASADESGDPGTG